MEEGGFEAFDGGAGGGVEGKVDVEGVEEAVKGVAGGGDAGEAEVAEVVDGLGVEGVAGADEGVGGREAFEVGFPGRGGVFGDVRSAVQFAEVAAPAEVVEAGVPDDVVVVAGAGGVAVVDHRVKGHLEGDVDLSPVPGQQAESGGEAASGALAAHKDLVAADAERLSVVHHIAEGRVALLEGDGITVSRRKAVLGAHDHGAEFLDEAARPAEQMGHRGHAGDIASAVDPEDAGNSPPRGGGVIVLVAGAVDQKLQLVAVRAGNVEGHLASSAGAFWLPPSSWMKSLTPWSRPGSSSPISWMVPVMLSAPARRAMPA